MWWNHRRSNMVSLDSALGPTHVYLLGCLRVVRLVSPSFFSYADRPLAFINREASSLTPKTSDAKLEQVRKSLKILSSQEEANLALTASTQNSPESSPKTKRRSLLDILPSPLNVARTLRESAKRNEGPWKPPEVRRDNCSCVPPC